MVSLQSQPPKKKTKKAKRFHRVDSEQLGRLDSLPWSSSLPDNNDDPFSLLAGSNELEGGFLSLEEIDESAYALEIPKSERGNLKEKQQKEVESKKRKRKEGDNVGDNEAGNEDSGEVAEGGSEDEVEEEEETKVVKNKKKKKQKKKKSEKVETTSDKIVEAVAG